MNELFIFLTLAVVLAVIVRFEMKAGPPRWNLSAWQADGHGGWLKHPILTVRGEEFQYATAQEYINKLQETAQQFQNSESDPGPIDEAIYQLERVKHTFVRHPSAGPPRAAAPSVTAASYLASAAASASDSKPEQTPLMALRFIPEIAEGGRVALANLIKSLYSNNADGFVYWKSELLKKNTGDATEYAGRVIDAVWAEASILYAKVFRNIKRFEVLPNSIFLTLSESIQILERLLSYDVTPPLPEIVVPPDTSLPPDPLERVFTIQDYIERGIDNEDEHREILVLAESSHQQFALRRVLIALSSSDQALHESLPLDFSGLAVMLSVLSKLEKDNTHFTKQCVSLAAKCAAQVPPDDTRYANVVTTFKACGLPVPQYAPHAAGNHSIRLAFDGTVSVVPRNTPYPANLMASPGAAATVAAVAPQSEADVLRAIEKSLFGLVGLERMKPLLAMDIFEFLTARQSRGRVFWGPPGVGKTELAQRLAGLREGFPGLSLGAGQARYISGVDGKLEVKEIVDSLPALSVLFVDEADKCLDPKTGMVSPAEATQVRHAIITHFQRKPILWVFLGVFSEMREEGAITDEALRTHFGPELAHRLDYADWGFPSWTLENLLKAVNGASSRRRLRYEDDAALVLAQYCIRTGGGVRAFDNLEAAIIRHARTSGIPEGTKVSLAIAQQILAKRGVQVG